MTDDALAASIAAEAGATLLELRSRGVAQGTAIGAAGDRLADDVIHQRLRTERPDDAILSEERACDRDRLREHRVWIVDPLDGTREYSEGRDDWAVHVALAIDGQPTAGAVALPVAGKVFSTSAPPPLAPVNSPLRIAVSRTRAAALCENVADRLGATVVPMGSAGAKAMAVLVGEVDIYLHAGGQYEWDNCAPAAVALAAGLHVSRLDGTPIRYNQADPLVPDLLICRPELADSVLATIAAGCADLSIGLPTRGVDVAPRTT